LIIYYEFIPPNYPINNLDSDQDIDFICKKVVGPPVICISEKIYGEDSEEVETLRNFRDNVLSKTPEGQEIIRLYYEWSPAIVEAMEEDEKFKEEIKAIIDEILPLIRKMLEKN